MKVYFQYAEPNNMVFITDGITVKLYDGAPSGMYCGIDLYADDVIEQLKDYFQKLYDSGELMDYDSIYSESEIDYDVLADEIDCSTLIFETDE